MIEAALEMCSYDPESATALLTDPSQVPALHRHLSRHKRDQRSMKRQVPINQLMVAQPYSKAVKQGYVANKLDSLDPITAPPSYTVISGSGTVVSLPALESEEPPEALSVTDGHIDTEDRKTPQELATEEREWRDKAEHERFTMMESFAQAGQQRGGALAGHTAFQGQESKRRMWEYGNRAAKCALQQLNPGILLLVNGQGGLEYRGFELGRGGITRLQRGYFDYQVTDG